MEEQSFELINGKNRDIPSVSGYLLSNEKRILLEKLRKGENIEKNIVFDYFVMMGFGDKRTWERTQKDVHGYFSVGAGQNSFFISLKTKDIFEKFVRYDTVRFYKSKLLFKNIKHDYWIMKIYYDYVNHFIFPQSLFSIHDSITNELILEFENTFSSNLDFENKVMDFQKKKQKFYVTKATFDKFSDIIILNSYFSNSGIYISEKLKIELETNQITGLNFIKTDIIFCFLSSR